MTVNGFVKCFESSVCRSYVNVQTGEVKMETYKNAEPAYVEMVKLLGSADGTQQLQKVSILLRVEVSQGHSQRSRESLI